MADALTITKSDQGPVKVLHLAGRLDGQTRDELLDAARAEQAADIRYLLIDLTNVDYISSAGLGVLLRTQKRLSQSGHQIILTHLNKMVRDVFKTARFDLIFKVEDVPAGDVAGKV